MRPALSITALGHPMNDYKNDISLEEELSRLREENVRLRKLLATHGIAWEAATISVRSPSPETPTQAGNRLSTTEKVALFRERFRGRTDVYPVRWESAKGKSGYSPACANEWRPGICHKPKVKCGQCDQRLLLPVTDAVIYDHLAGKQTIGVYPLLPDDRCWFLAADFDDELWENDAKGFMQSCSELDIPALLEISRSGNGAHVWIFFSEPVPAREARQLGGALISHTCNQTRQLSLASYDRLFPNQDTLPKGGFDNLIALPLQKQPRELDRSVFVDKKLAPYTDQWALLSSIRPLSAAYLENAILRASGGRHPLDVGFTRDRTRTNRGNAGQHFPTR